MFFPLVVLVRWDWLVAAYSKILEPFFLRLHRLVLFLGVTSLWLLTVLWRVVEYSFTDLYLPLGSTWKLAFPLSWRIVLSTLTELPVLAFLQLIWLCIRYPSAISCLWQRRSLGARSSPSQGYTMLPRSDSSSVEEGTPSGVRNDDDDDISSDASSHLEPSRVVGRVWFVTWLAIFCISIAVLLRYEHPGDVRYRPLIENAVAHPKREGYANKEKIFFAALLYNNQDVIPYWSDSLIKAIRYLGEDNVFVSIVESESQDQSPQLLRQLDKRLDKMDVARRILTDDTAVKKPDELNGNNRTEFLAALRNRALEPLVEMGGYDKVVYLNDIFVEPETIIELIYTANGEYDFACGLDFGDWGLYDLWVIRDKQGSLPSSIWPYFFDQEDYVGMIYEWPVPVFSCWNGIVAFKADPILPIHLRSNLTLSTDPLPFSLPSTHPASSAPSLLGPSPALTPPIGFRGSAPDECYSSECFLLPYDFRRVFNMQRILVNPRVIVAYKWRFYVYFKWFMRHPVLKWWVEQVYDGAWMQKDMVVVGDPREITRWDGGDCHPWW